ncbi:regulatory protein GemA [Acidovorax sp. GBBC 3332]|nr:MULTISPECIES: regulatory protein GemA [unclassified Acidovorax]MDA8449799.1 regulatory protein GemA [Acidovorax sp. GBBC 3297]MDA8459244.1 regulatory protein GemA [Acidovorax sp. GBBC 3333]MDA8464281.1 regulatory protein GemA [Acidovorax sp. GBBC 3332]MDA8469509.1 regulatory protein GemA [Acidovorax sp. GBBC 3299]
MTTTKTKPSAEAGRSRLIKLIHVARRELERAGTLDEPGYRDMLRSVSKGRHDSASEMSYTELNAALDRLKGVGFKVRKQPGTRSMAGSLEARKARALWLFLHHGLGVVKDPSEQALAAYVRRIAKVDDLRWAHGDRTAQVIESLKAWAMRFLPAAVHSLRDQALAAGPGALSPDQIEHALAAQHALERGEGFDMHWAAWEHLMQALGRPISADLAPIGGTAA